MKKPTVHVLLSTYNGERYIRAQIDSVLAQIGVEVRLSIRDDGSSDGTIAVLAEYAAREPHIAVEYGLNKGVVGSFFTLLAACPATGDYFAFCDQDDVWKPDKLARAVLCCNPYAEQVPVLYASRVEYVTEQLARLDFSPMPRSVGLSNAMVENQLIGCTMVFNRRLRELVLARLPQYATMHDAWLYLVASALGKVIFDDFVSVAYRQHGGNVVGGTTSALQRNMKRVIPFLRSLKHGKQRNSDQVEEFLRLYENLLGEQQKRLAADFVLSKPYFMKRLSLALGGQYRRDGWVEDAIMRLKILTGYY